MTLRAQIEAFPADALFLIFTTEGHVYVGTVKEIEEDVVRLVATDRRTEIVLNFADVSGVRPFIEEPEE